MALMDFLNIKLGFGFSAGLFDYVLNFNKATNPLWLFPIGAVYALIYYSVFRFFIVKFNMKVPGRDDVVSVSSAPSNTSHSTSKALGFIEALGGAENLEEVAACTTRLRLVMKDNQAVNAGVLKDLGARGVIRPTATTLQVVIGPTAEILADEIKHALQAGVSVPADAPSLTLVPNSDDGNVFSENASQTDNVIAADQFIVEAIFTALGGTKNVRGIETKSSRLVLELKDGSIVDEKALLENGVRGFVKINKNIYHMLIGPNAEEIGSALRSQT